MRWITTTPTTIRDIPPVGKDPTWGQLALSLETNPTRNDLAYIVILIINRKKSVQTYVSMMSARHLRFIYFILINYYLWGKGEGKVFILGLLIM